ncbi:MAG: PKD domain-containing protein [bacterium]
MKKIASVCLLAVFLSGCATYKFQHGQPPYDKGYIASRDSYVILEYTVGSDNSVPAELDLAKQRFWKRHKMVEHYYKKMERIENRFKMAAYDPAAMFVKLICGVLRLPFIAISDYKYDHNPVYREKIRKIEEEKDLREEARVAKLKERLDLYIQSVLTTEKPSRKAESIKKELASIEAAGSQTVSAELDKVQRQQKAAKQKPQPAKKQPRVVSGEPIAVIVAKPQRGFSPLTVHLYSSRSRSPAGKIVSCSWDFGDGDISNKTNPTNTYYSGSSEMQAFTVTLTVTDAQGNTATATSVIEVLNK